VKLISIRYDCRITIFWATQA